MNGHRVGSYIISTKSPKEQIKFSQNINC